MASRNNSSLSNVKKGRRQEPAFIVTSWIKFYFIELPNECRARIYNLVYFHRIAVWVTSSRLILEHYFVTLWKDFPDTRALSEKENIQAAAIIGRNANMNIGSKPCYSGNAMLFRIDVLLSPATPNKKKYNK